VEIYRPVICRMAGFRGMQEADAEDLAQQVLMAISGAIERWEVDPERATFRTWLKRVANNAILNALTRGVPDRGSGDDDIRRFLEQRPESEGPELDLLQTEFRRETFLRAARQIRDEFTDETWNSFWLTAVQGMEVDAVAKELGRTRRQRLRIPQSSDETSQAESRTI
jgi:RNA polymerase sigma-70 factor (ECF subfamily)